MATIRVVRGEQSYRLWDYLRANNVEFTSYRIYSIEPAAYQEEFLAFDIADEKMAVESVLRFAHP